MNMTQEDRDSMKGRIAAILDKLPPDKWPCAIIIVGSSGQGYIPLVDSKDDAAMNAVQNVIIEIASDMLAGTDSEDIHVTLDEGT